jgi:hypothetical protein
MGLVGLGSKLVATVDNPAKCPSGTWNEPKRVWTGSVWVDMGYECYKGEPWTCEWFGWGCKGVVPVDPPSPQTVDQMEKPSQWTPEQMAKQWKEEERQNIKEWAEATRGIDLFSVGTYQAGKAAGDAAEDLLIYTGLGLAIAAGVAVFLLVKFK